MENFWSIINNTVIFMAMIMFVFIWPVSVDKRSITYRIIMSILLSGIAAISMFNSVHVGNGLFIDARYAIPIITFIFFGTVPGIVTGMTIMLIRYFILGGGPGATIGITYVVVQCIVMFLYKKYYYNSHQDGTIITSVRLFFVTLILQFYLLTSPIYFIPTEVAIPIIHANALILLTIYPIVVFVFSMIVGFRMEYYSKLERIGVQEQFFELILQRSPNPMAIYDADGTIFYVNEAFIDQSGYKRNEYVTILDWFTLVASKSDVDQVMSFQGVKEVIETYPKLDFNIHTKHNGLRIWSVDQKQAGVLPNGKEYFISNSTDVTEQREYEDKLLYTSHHDYMTGLPNRRYFDDVFVKSTEINEVNFIVYGDMNNLKRLNDYKGHQVGDQAIIKTAEMLKEVFKNKANIFRFGGDEFLIATRCKTSNQCMTQLEKVNDELAKLDFDSVPIGLSFGIEEYDRSVSIDDIILRAESKMYEHKIFESASARSGTIDVMLTMLFEKDPETERHSRRVQDICLLFADHLNLSTNESNLLYRSGLLHDIGKILIPTSIINHEGKLSAEEYEIIKKHSYLGYRILSSKGHLSTIGDIVVAHHEHPDGSGYPYGLKGEEIPYIARILNIIDAFEAMTSDRPYKKRRTYEEAKEELLKFAGTQFDAKLVNQFIEVIPDIPEAVMYTESSLGLVSDLEY